MSTKSTRLGYLSGENNDARFDYVEPCSDAMDSFFQAHGEWLDVETDTFKDTFYYQGHGVWDHETMPYTESIPVLRLGQITVNRFLRDGESLSEYYEYAWKYLELDKVVEFFIDDLKALDILTIATVPDLIGAVTWEGIALLYHLYDNSKDRKKCLKLALKRAGEAITTGSLILATAETLKAKGSNV